MTRLATALLAELDDAALDELAELLAPRLAERLGRNGDNQWFEARGAADYLAMTLDALHKRTTPEERAKPGAIPCHQDVPGGKLYFLKSELDEWRRG
jgi:hypothetical protein